MADIIPGHTFDKKSVFHSHMRTENENNGAMIVRFKSKPQVSQWKKDPTEAGHWYVPFHIHSDPNSYTLQVENEAIKAMLDNVNPSLWYRVEASGGLRGSEASMILESDVASTDPARNVERLPSPVKQYDTVYEAAFDALFATGDITSRYYEQFGRPPTEAELRFATGLLIRNENSGHPIINDDIEDAMVSVTPDTDIGDMIEDLVSIGNQVYQTDTEKDNFITWLDDDSRTEKELIAARASLQMMIPTEQE